MTPQIPEHEATKGHIKPRTALITLLSLLAGALMGGLLWHAGNNLAGALALALPTIGGAFVAFDKLIE